MHLLVGWRCFIYSGAFFAVFWGHFLEQRAGCCELHVIWLNSSFVFVSRPKSATWILLSSSSGSWETCVTAFPPGCLFQDGWGIAPASLACPADSFHYFCFYCFLFCFFFIWITHDSCSSSKASWASGRKDCDHVWETNGSGRVIAEGFWVHRIGDAPGRCCSGPSNRNACSPVFMSIKSNAPCLPP